MCYNIYEIYRALLFSLGFSRLKAKEHYGTRGKSPQTMVLLSGNVNHMKLYESSNVFMSCGQAPCGSGHLHMCFGYFSCKHTRVRFGGSHRFIIILAKKTTYNRSVKCICLTTCVIITSS